VTRKPVAAKAVDPAEAEEAFGDFRGGHRLLVAVSGGPDSMAMMALLARWREADIHRRPVLYVATVDHGLRAASADEAVMVAGEAARLGLSHAILRWEGQKPDTGIQEVARAARYTLLAAEAQRVGAGCIATAHTMDDQAETVLMRFLRGSGPAGLAGMARSANRGGFTHWRPLLGLRKERLIATCEALGLPFILDPSNSDPAFARPRLRALMSQLETEGVSAERLARLGLRQARANLSLDVQATEALGPAEPVRNGLRFHRHQLAKAQPETQIRAVLLAFARARNVVRAGRGEPAAFLDDGAPLPLEKLESALLRLDKAMCEARPYAFTLGGFVVSLLKDGSLRLVKEKPRGTKSRGGIHPVHPPSLGKGGDEA
jgi:tRNA(Ile)-lysidine synthase